MKWLFKVVTVLLLATATGCVVLAMALAKIANLDDAESEWDILQRENEARRSVAP